jgi:hypothetical protein
MAPSLSGERKRKRGRREWDDGGSISGAHGARELTHQARRGQRGTSGSQKGEINTIAK